jgi:hypothetical protein
VLLHALTFRILRRRIVGCDAELVVCKNVSFSLGAFDAVEDGVSVLGPRERDRVVVTVSAYLMALPPR